MLLCNPNPPPPPRLRSLYRVRPPTPAVNSNEECSQRRARNLVAVCFTLHGRNHVQTGRNLPPCPRQNADDGSSRLRHDFIQISCEQLAVSFQNATVHQYRVDVLRHTGQNKHIDRITAGQHIQRVHPHKNEVGALSRRDRSYS